MSVRRLSGMLAVRLVDGVLFLGPIKWKKRADSFMLFPDLHICITVNKNTQTSTCLRPTLKWMKIKNIKIKETLWWFDRKSWELFWSARLTFPESDCFSALNRVICQAVFNIRCTEFQRQLPLLTVILEIVTMWLFLFKLQKEHVTLLEKPYQI